MEIKNRKGVYERVTRDGARPGKGINRVPHIPGTYKLEEKRGKIQMSSTERELYNDMDPTGDMV